MLLWMLACVAQESPSKNVGKFGLVWEHQFDGASNTPPDPSIWVHDVGGDGWGNNQLEYNSDRTDSVRLNGEGFLEIVAQREDFEGNEFTSGRITTNGLWTGGYGKYEARIKLPEGQGIWPAFWLLGADFNTVGWPSCGEIDILEMRGDNPYEVSGTIHGPGYSGGDGNGGVFQYGEPLSDDFHTYRVDIDPGHISWFVDDEHYLTISSGDIPSTAPWVFDGEYFILLNVAVGGNYLEDPDDNTEFPVSMLVDYIRYYERVE